MRQGPCYGPHIPDSISTQGGFGKIGSQCTGCRTDRTSGVIRQGVAESHN